MHSEKDEERKHECTVCEKKFDKKQTLDNHLRTHTGVKPFKCNICGKEFAQYGTLKNHRIIHSEERPYKCNYKDCKYTTKRKHTLIRHVNLLHEGAIVSEVIIIPPKKPKKVYKCDECGRDFRWSSALTNHLISHGNTRPFSCDICKKTFKRKYHLNRHMREVHPQEQTASSSEVRKEIF
ncbi:zinc finger protein 22-like [Centruroides vittatus]|uniref:zinc finger protein 22-like n=1 Tax=Centruroides vittatus TaxID=120091 RepID=UPI003510622B